MNYGVRIHEDADNDVDAIVWHIGSDDRDAGLRFYLAAEETYRRIQENPYLYSIYPLPAPKLAGLRRAFVTGFEVYLVFYRIDSDMVEIIRVLHGVRDIARILSEDAN